MIYVLHGDNEFMKQAEIARIAQGVRVCYRDGEELSAGDLQVVSMEQTLFGDEIIAIKGLSNNAATWSAIPDSLMMNQRDVIFIEGKIDKRTKTYKWLQKNATMIPCENFTERQKPQLVSWCVQRGAVHGAVISDVQAGVMIDRLGYDQLRLDMVLQQLALLDEVTDEVINNVIPLPKSENVFLLLQAALHDERARVREIIAYLEMTGGNDEAYRVMGLLTSQAVQLSALVLAHGDIEKVANDFSANPYALRQLVSDATKMNRNDVARLLQRLHEADVKMKTTNVHPWMLIEVALIGFAGRNI